MLSKSGSLSIAIIFLCIVSLTYTDMAFAQTRPPLASIAFSSYSVVGHIEDNNSSMMFVETHEPTMAVVVMADSLKQNEDALAANRLEKCRAAPFEQMVSALSPRLEALRVAQSHGQTLSQQDAAGLRVMPGVITWLNGMSKQPQYACVLGRTAARAK